MSEWVSVAVSVVGGAASITSVLIAVLVIRHARRLAIATLRAHIALAEAWVAGGHGHGWVEADVRPYEHLIWASPQWSVLQQHSASSFAQVGLLGNLGLSAHLAPKLAAVAQSLQNFNTALARCEAFKLGEIDTYMVVRNKLAEAMKELFGSDGPPRDDITADRVKMVFATARLTERELLWCRTLASMLKSAHVHHIGSHGGGGLFQQVWELRREFDRLY